MEKIIVFIESVMAILIIADIIWFCIKGVIKLMDEQVPRIGHIISSFIWFIVAIGAIIIKASVSCIIGSIALSIFWLTWVLVIAYKDDLPAGINPQLTFKKWLAFYNIAPNKWEIRSDFPIRKNAHGYASFCDDSSHVRFKFFDWIQYKIFYLKHELHDKHEERFKTRQDSNDATMALLKLVEQDVNEVITKSNKDMSLAAKDLQQIVQRM